MKRNIVILLFFTFYLNSYSQYSKDTIYSPISVMYNKVVPSNLSACKAELIVKYVPQKEMIILNFELPNYDWRGKTTLADYAIFKLKNSNLKLHNLVEKPAKGLMYKFSLAVAKDDMQKLLLENLSKIIFYFEPNEDFIVKSLLTHQVLDGESRKELGILAKKVSIVKISNPDKKQMNELNVWLHNL